MLYYTSVSCVSRFYRYGIEFFINGAIGTTGYKPVSYDDENGNHKVKGIEVKVHKEEKGATKCGNSKCGSGKCGSK